MPKKFTYEYVKYFIEVESESGCKLLSTEYKNSSEYLEILCKCQKNKFFVNFNTFKQKKRLCNECSRRSASEKMKRKFSDDEVNNIIELFENKVPIEKIKLIYKTKNTIISRVLKEHGYNTRRQISDYYSSKELATGRKYDCDEDYFENIDSPTKAYWLGFLYADGCVVAKKGTYGEFKGIHIELALKAEDDYHIYNFAQCIKSSHPLKYRNTKCNGKLFPSCRISIGSVKMGKDLIKWGCTPNKSLTLVYPEKLDDKYFCDFLRGYFDGDGCLSFTEKETKYNYRASMNGTYEFLTEIKNKLEKLGVFTRGVKSTKSKTFDLTISSYNLADFYNLLYGNAEYFLGRKLDKYRDMLFARNDDFIISDVAKLFRLIY